MLTALTAWCAFITVTVFFLTVNLRNARLAGTAVCLILIVQIGVRPLMFFLGLDSPAPYAWFDSKSWDLIAMALLLATAWVFVINVTSLAFSRVSVGQAVFPQVNVTPHPRRLRFVALAATALNVLGTVYLVQQAGGVPQFVYAVKIEKSLKGLYLIREIGTLAVAILIYVYVVAVEAGRKGTKRPLAPGLVLLLILLNFGINYLWGNRYNIAVMTLCLAVAQHLFVRRIRPSQALIAAVAFMAVLEGLKEIRNLLVSEVTGRESGNNFDFWLEISASLHFNQFDALLLAIRDAGDKFDFRQGRDALNGLLSWVPRAIYPEKETFQVGGWFRRVYEPTRVNGWPITVVGEWYVNFGVFGIWLGAILSGMVIAAIDNVYRLARSNPWHAAIGAAIAFNLLDGGLDFGFIQAYVLLVVPLFLVAVYLRINFKRGMRPADMTQPTSLTSAE